MIYNPGKIRIQRPRGLNKIRDDLWIWQKEEEPPVAKLYVLAGVDELKLIEAKLATINSLDKIEEVLKYCEHFYENEENRREQTERKATILAGFSGTATAGFLVFLNIFLDTLKQADWLVRLVGITLSALGLIALVSSIFFSVVALKARGYRFPKPMKIFDLAEQSLEDVWKRRAAEYFHAYVKNQAIDDRKVNAYKYASSAFQRAIYLVILLVLVIFAYSVLDSSTLMGSAPTTTPMVGTATVPFTPTPTLTVMPSAMVTPSPTAPLTLTSVPSLTVTPSPSPTLTFSVQSTQSQGP